MSDTPTWRSEYFDGTNWLLIDLHPTRDAAHNHARGVRWNLRIAKKPWRNRVRVVRVEAAVPADPADERAAERFAEPEA